MDGGQPADRDRVRAWYTANARRYDRLHPGVPGDAEFYAALARGRRVLEVGAGTGRVTAALARTAASVLALDNVPAMLAIAAGRTSSPSPYPSREGFAGSLVSLVSLVCADMRALPVVGPFDLVVLAYRTLQHLSDRERPILFRDLRGLLAAAGLLAFDTWHGPLSAGRAAQPALTAVAQDTIAAELARAGFRVIRVDGGFHGEAAEPSSYVRVWQALVLNR